MVHSSQAHLLADVFTESNESHSDNSSYLMDGLLFILLVFSAEMEHLLNLKHITRTCISTGLHHQLTESGSLFIWNKFTHLHGWLSSALLSKEQKTKTKSENSHEWVVQVIRFFLHQSLQDTLSSIFVTGSTIDEANAQCCHCLKLCCVARIKDNRRNCV